MVKIGSTCGIWQGYYDERMHNPPPESIFKYNKENSNKKQHIYVTKKFTQNNCPLPSCDYHYH